jgi:hypothetical protein
MDCEPSGAILLFHDPEQLLALTEDHVSVVEPPETIEGTLVDIETESGPGVGGGCAQKLKLTRLLPCFPIPVTPTP